MGQSFLYNQIRKMIGMAIQVARRDLPITLISDAFGEKRVDVPKAPAEGLFLGCCFFEPYNNKVTAKDCQVRPIDFDEPSVKAAAEAFAAENILPFIASNEASKCAFSIWSYRQDRRKFPSDRVPIAPVNAPSKIGLFPKKRKRSSKGATAENNHAK